MRPAEDGSPRLGPTPKTLGARPAGPTGEDGDIAVGEDGMVRPETGGMSVSPPPAENIVPYRRPPEHGGTAKKLKLYEMDTDELPEELVARPEEPRGARPDRACLRDELRGLPGRARKHEGPVEDRLIPEYSRNVCKNARQCA